MVCEGIPDALTAAQAGYRSVGILGSQAPDQRVAARIAARAARHGDTVVAVVDADPAGRAWGEHLAGLLAGHDVGLTVVEPPNGLDLNAWADHDATWSAVLDRHQQPEPGRVPATMTAGLEGP